MSGPYTGIDVGAKQLHAVSVNGDGGLRGARMFDAAELDAIVDWAAEAEVIAIDSPDRPSICAHAADSSLPPKFQTARCAEVALARTRNYWVPWVTPEDPAPGSWIAVGIELHRRLAATGLRAIEVYPHAAFRELACGGALPKKTSGAGIAARTGLLRSAGFDDAFLDMWSHDALDAAIGALVARDNARGQAVRVGCDDAGCSTDGSAIWLPRRPVSGAATPARPGR
jgi:predicted nuclease with RNAse H fold